MPLLPEDENVIQEFHRKNCEKDDCGWTLRDKQNDYWWSMWNKWRVENNLASIRLPYTAVNAYDRDKFKCFHILSGTSPRAKKELLNNENRLRLHSVVGYRGAIVHDPHPDGTGLLTLDEIELILPVDPSKPILQGYLKQVSNGN